MSCALFLIPHDEYGSIHGGKIRSGALHIGFERAGFDVVAMHIPQETANVHYLPEGLENVPLIRDLALAFSSVESSDSIQRAIGLRPSFLVLEHPWLWSAAQAILREVPTCRLIYSSHNIEWKLKYDILKRYAPREARRVANVIFDLERTVAQASSAILATSQTDAQEIREWTTAPVFVVPNGVDHRRFAERGRPLANFPYALVVGSSHPPNIEGCQQLLGSPELWLPPMTEIWIVGSLGSALSTHWRSGRCSQRSGAVRLIGEVSFETLNRMLTQAHAVLLPIAYGQGSNLKTAEALYTGRPVVASDSAMRGFEEYAFLKNVSVAHSPIDFKLNTSRFLLSWYESRDEQEVESLTWDKSQDRLQEILELGF